MAVTAVECVSLPVQGLAELVAAGPSFQALVGAANQSAAMAFVEKHAIEGRDVVRPFALVREGEQGARSERKSTTSMIGQATLELILEIPVAVVCTITRSGGTATATCVGHGFEVGEVLNIYGAGQAGYNGRQTVLTTPTTDTWTFAVTGSPVTPATGTIKAIRVTPNFEVEADRFMNVAGGIVNDLKVYGDGLHTDTLGGLMQIDSIERGPCLRSDPAESNTNESYYGVGMIIRTGLRG